MTNRNVKDLILQALLQTAYLSSAACALAISILASGMAGAAEPDIAAASGESPSRVPGKVGQAMYFDGADDRVVVDHTPALNAADGLTIAFWVKADGWSHQATMLMKAGAFEITKRESPTGMYFWGYFPGHREPINLVWAPMKFDLGTDRWHHLAVTYDAKTTQAQAYLDGELQASEVLRERYPQLSDYRLASNDAPLTMGLGRRPFHGSLDAVYLYDRALSEAQIHQLMQEQAVPGATAAWTFNGSNRRAIRDESGNRLHGRVDRGLSLNNLPELGRRVNVPVLHQSPALTIWQQQAMRKVMRQDVPQAVADDKHEPAVSLAANERESFQVVLRPTQAMRNVSIKTSALRQQDGHGVIAVDQIKLASVRYIPVVKPSQTAIDGQGTTDLGGEAGFMFNEQGESSPGWYPDPLPQEHTGLDLDAARNHPFWVTIFARPGTPAGTYVGTIQVTADGQQPIDLPINIRVWDFELPRQFHTRNSAYFPGQHQPTNREQTYRLFADHHFSVTPLLAEPSVTFDGTEAQIDTEAFDREAELAIDKLGMNVLYLPGWDIYEMPKAAAAVGAKWHDFTISEREGKLAEPFKQAFSSYLKAVTQHLESKGWLGKTRITLVDEPSVPADFSLSREFAELVRNAAPEVEVMVTRWPRKELMGVPDIWSLGFFQIEQMQRAMERGEKVEWYPNWHTLIDRSLMNTRVVGWVMWKHGISGILIWRVNHGWGSDPEQMWRVPRYDYPDGRTVWGSGLLLYPDASFRAVSSIRWEILRDALEDYEYLYLLRTLCERAEVQGIKVDGEVATARALLDEAVRAMVPHYEAHPEQWRWTKVEWSVDDAVLQSYRSQVALSIERLVEALAEAD